jgi:hypothetical protein
VAVLLRVRRWSGLAVVACLAAAGVSCETLVSDSATRMAYAVRDGAVRLKSSQSDTMVLSVAVRSWPGGCPAGYRVEWRADADRLPGLGIICTTGTRGYATIAYRSFVKVPRALHVTKEKGEPTTIGLRKQPDGTIVVVAVQ